MYKILVYTHRHARMHTHPYTHSQTHMLHGVMQTLWLLTISGPKPHQDGFWAMLRHEAAEANPVIYLSRRRHHWFPIRFLTEYRPPTSPTKKGTPHCDEIHWSNMAFITFEGLDAGTELREKRPLSANVFYHKLGNSYSQFMTHLCEETDEGFI